MDDIYYRQHAIKDAMRNPETVRSGYQILTDTINKAREKMWFFGLNNTPAEAIFDSVKILEIYIEGIDKIRDVFLSKKSSFESRAFASLIEAFEQYFDRSI